MTLKSILRRWLRKQEPREWEYLPDGWDMRGLRGEGWNDSSVLQTQIERWPRFLERVAGNAPLAIDYEDPAVPTRHHSSHDAAMALGYVLGRAAQQKGRVEVLDWGGGLGHFYVLSKALFPSLDLDYHVYDTPLVCAAGRKLLTESTFHHDDSCLARRYDLVLASGSLHYSSDWKRDLGRLAAASRAYVYVTRLPCVTGVASYVAVQHPQRYGYEADFVSWVVNKSELLAHAESIGLKLVREFLLLEAPYIHNAPEQAEAAGFLFSVRGAGQTK